MSDNTNMHLIMDEITDLDFNPNFTPPTIDKEYYTRVACRGILVYKDMIALPFISKEDYHKLPGGGVEENETLIEAFKREIKEETGCECEVELDEKDNAVKEIRHKFKMIQISHIFFARVIGDPKKAEYTPEEIEEGFELQWVPINKIYEVLDSDKPKDYQGKFIQKRDRAIIDFYSNKINI